MALCRTGHAFIAFDSNVRLRTRRLAHTEDFGLGVPNAPIARAWTGLYVAGPRIEHADWISSLTEAGGDITATWNDVTDATGYVLEWREEGSGDAWQTVDVSAPPHTFTP